MHKQSGIHDNTQEMRGYARTMFRGPIFLTYSHQLLTFRKMF